MDLKTEKFLTRMNVPNSRFAFKKYFQIYDKVWVISVKKSSIANLCYLYFYFLQKESF